MTKEYVTQKEYSINQLNNVIDGIELLYEQTDESSIVLLVSKVLVAGISLWVVAPTWVAVSSLIAELFLDTYEGFSNTRSLIENGLYDLKDIAYTMYRYGYDRVKFDTAILEVKETNGTVRIYQSARATAYHTPEGWVYSG
ncbi:hypothetical protein [Lutispora thermophila]|uniref:Uncharacterized protein n=1 Tax=Lutispora thermophila DSM 19022 TaxID=1122184 RepID=A0A1M6I7W2_9FIRM|nr:hypothetical protein [Lutispora thermophila]SHJ30539.1 hypothetical protein SAMN02745176_03118 [Lutispora thermophila DSM 19022]